MDAPQEFVNLMKLLVQEGDLDILPELPGALASVATGARQPVRAEVTSAVELTDAEKDALRKTLAQQYGADLVFTFQRRSVVDGRAARARWRPPDRYVRGEPNGRAARVGRVGGSLETDEVQGSQIRFAAARVKVSRLG